MIQYFHFVQFFLAKWPQMKMVSEMDTVLFSLSKKTEKKNSIENLNGLLMNYKQVYIGLFVWSQERDMRFKSWPIYLYISNLTRYVRILTNIVAFGEFLANRNLWNALYYFIFVYDELDGYFVCMLNKVFIFGVVTKRLAKNPSDSMVKVFMVVLN